MAKNVITELSVTEDGATKANYASECPAGEVAHQFLYELTQKLLRQSRTEPIIRIANTALTIDRRDVTSLTLTLQF